MKQSKDLPGSCKQNLSKELCPNRQSKKKKPSQLEAQALQLESTPSHYS